MNIQSQLKNALKEFPIRWEDTSKFHLTVQFLGDTDLNTIEYLKSNFKKLKTGFKKINLRLNGIGFFPNEKFPKVVFASLEDDSNKCIQLAEKIKSITEKFGFDLPDGKAGETKKFVPHITLGRYKASGKKLQGFTLKINFEPTEFIFDSFFLMKSELTPMGAQYNVIEKFSLC